MTRIGILGLGGVGGYFGGLLAKTYHKSNDVEVIFIARGATQNAIIENGLKIVTDETEVIVHPDLVSDNPDQIGQLDYLICATKTYDIEESLSLYQKCITPKTIILPLYNGVDAPERIKKLFPDNAILQGCVYIVSMIHSPGTIRKIGFFEKLFFGSKTASALQLIELQRIFKTAKIESYLVDNIEETVWEKFIFISALASASSYLNQNNGEILANKASKKLYKQLLMEIYSVAKAKGLQLPEDIVEQTILKLKKSPKDTTSSMRRDLLAGRNIEATSLTRFVVNEGLNMVLKHLFMRKFQTLYYRKYYDSSLVARTKLIPDEKNTIPSMP